MVMMMMVLMKMMVYAEPPCDYENTFSGNRKDVLRHGSALPPTLNPPSGSTFFSLCKVYNSIPFRSLYQSNTNPPHIPSSPPPPPSSTFNVCLVGENSTPSIPAM